jgi:small GTP-binding protein
MCDDALHFYMPVLKAILVGNSGVGKTCLIRAFLQKPVGHDPVSTVSPSYACQELARRDGSTVCLQIWDTAGQERYCSVSQMFWRKADVAVVCFEAGSQRSMESVTGWVKKVKCEVPGCALLFVATKADLLAKEEVPAVLADAEGLLRTFRPTGIIMTSALSRDGVDELFSQIAEMYRPKTLSQQRIMGQTPPVRLCC